jgi:hypothetical protein
VNQGRKSTVFFSPGAGNRCFALASAEKARGWRTPFGPPYGRAAAQRAPDAAGAAAAQLGNRPGVRRRHTNVAALTSTLITITIALSVGLGALAAGTGAGRALQRRRER